MTVLNEQWDGSADVLACFSKAKLLIDGKVSFPISLRHGCLVISVHYTAKIVNIAAICSLNESSELAKPYPTSTAKGEIYVC